MQTNKELKKENKVYNSELTRNELDIINTISKNIADTMKEISIDFERDDIDDSDTINEMLKYTCELIETRKKLFDMFMNM